MAPNDLEGLVQFIVNLIGNILANWGHSWTDSAANPLHMWVLTTGIFGENGGLIYWCNEKLVWLIEQILEGLTFTSPLT